MSYTRIINKDGNLFVETVPEKTEEPTVEELVDEAVEEVEEAIEAVEEAEEAIEEAEEAIEETEDNDKTPCPHCEFVAASSFGLKAHIRAKHEDN